MSTEQQKSHILAIGAHAGDMELCAGATMAKYVQEGHKVTLLHLTPGEKGHQKLTPVEYAKQKIEEAHKFADMIGADVKFFDYKDAEIPVHDEIKYQVADVIREVKPDILITHWKNSMHKDHSNTHYIVQDAQFYAALKNIERPLPNHFARKMYFTDNWEDADDFEPQVSIDIPDDAYELWLKALSQYAFARGETGWPYIEYYSALKIVRGAPVRMKRAEAFGVPRGSLNKRLQMFE